jgi:hypothetical protein
MSGRNPKDCRSEKEMWLNLDESVLILKKNKHHFYITLKKFKLAFNVESVAHFEEIWSCRN